MLQPSRRQPSREVWNAFKWSAVIVHLAVERSAGLRRFYFLIKSILGNRYVPFFYGCYAATQLALQVQQKRTHVVCGNKEARKRLTDSNGTPAMDLGP